jgi:hypothetical protein
MQQEPPDQTALGCLKGALLDVLIVILVSCFWCAFIGPKGILVGIAQYVVVRFIFFFERVFTPARKE